MIVNDLVRLEQLLVSYKSNLRKRDSQRVNSQQWQYHDKHLRGIERRLIPLLVEYYDRTEHPEEFLTP